MTKEELINISKQNIRGNNEYMLAYISLFKKQFGYEPSCAGCTFESDWNKFIKTSKNTVNTKNIKQMEDKKYILKRQLKDDILAYRIEGSNKAYRIYGRDITDDFAQKYLKYGTAEQIELRKKQFEKLPSENVDDSEQTETKENKTGASVNTKKTRQKKQVTEKESENNTSENVNDLQQSENK